MNKPQNFLDYEADPKLIARLLNDQRRDRKTSRALQGTELKAVPHGRRVGETTKDNKQI